MLICLDYNLICAKFEWLGNFRARIRVYKDTTNKRKRERKRKQFSWKLKSVDGYFHIHLLIEKHRSLPSLLGVAYCVSVDCR